MTDRRATADDATADDAGFTMVEVLVTIALLGTVMAFAVAGWASWSRAHALQGAAEDARSMLRHAQQRAITEGTAMCVAFDGAADRWSLHSGPCADVLGARLLGPVEAPGAVDVLPGARIGFNARGGATGGPLVLARRDGEGERRVRAEELTGRVSIS